MENGEQPPKVRKVRKKLNLIQLREWTQDLILGLTSPDAWTQRMSAVFFLCIVGILALLFTMTSYGWHVRKANLLAKAVIVAQHQKEIDEKASEEERKKGSVLSLGMFLLELKPFTTEEVAKDPPSNMAEIEIVIVCDTQRTRDYINDNMVLIRNHLTNILAPVSRDDMLSPEGKRHLRETLRRKLNGWLKKGEIRELYFPKLIVS